MPGADLDELGDEELEEDGLEEDVSGEDEVDEHLLVDDEPAVIPDDAADDADDDAFADVDTLSADVEVDVTGSADDADGSFAADADPAALHTGVDLDDAGSADDADADADSDADVDADADADADDDTAADADTPDAGADTAHGDTGELIEAGELAQVLIETDESADGPLTDIVSSVLADDVPAEDAALSLRGVTKVFGQTRAVDGIDLTVPAGTFYGLVGPNGAGKTTTLSMIAGLLQPDRGAISVNGVDAIADPVHAKGMMGVLPDRLRTFDRLTGRQLLYYYGMLRGLSPSVVESRTADLARAFDLTDALGRVVSDYSVGMSKKVMLAGALIHSPRVLVLDEPFESVDPVSSSVILDILGTYVEHGGTVILSSHGMDLVERVCSRVAVIVAGQVLAEGTIDEVRGELTLEQRFVELAGGLSDVEGLEWLHTFSD
ncbi:ABC transporter ATP-binding protein [Microbacterium sp. SSW1-59]|uniref:ABC transporter ATP-binding protein n=1 Tax=Microbacterium xanthum TaxID=3079794 RepID=UPI002AD51482|nr:ABC transporter ATP-binding protein [Microbacterium sp. SSW1-59]MDZ8202108.1 ABC transporter ATP-binding protein [Microbacterium sp. SSW1-59]